VSVTKRRRRRPRGGGKPEAAADVAVGADFRRQPSHKTVDAAH
jgi:hypothetical protein